MADLLSKFGEEEAKQPSGADKKKRGSTKPNTEQHLLDLLQAQCFCALRTRPQLDQAFFPVRTLSCNIKIICAASMCEFTLCVIKLYGSNYLHTAHNSRNEMC